MLKSKLEALSIKDCFFFSIYFINMHNNNSLIHEVMTLMEKLFKFWQLYLSVQIVYLIKKSFLKHVMMLWFMDLKKKGMSQAQKVFEGFKDLGSTSIIHNSFYVVVFVEEMTYNHVNFKDQNSLNINHNANQTFLWWIINLNHLKTSKVLSLIIKWQCL